MTETRVTTFGKKFLLAPLVLVLGLLLAHSAAAQDTLDLEKAIRIGDGKTMVVEFTDPDCPYCRKAEPYFQGKTHDVTRYIFLYPLKMHPDAETKAQYILSAKDKAKAYMDVISGRFDKNKTTAVITPEGVKLLQEHQNIARDYNVDAVPTFIIYGRIVKGFDVNKLDDLIR